MAMCAICITNLARRLANKTFIDGSYMQCAVNTWSLNVKNNDNSSKVQLNRSLSYSAQSIFKQKSPIVHGISPHCGIWKRGQWNYIHTSKRNPKALASYLSPKALVYASSQSVQPYLRLVRLDRPIGTWLLFLPCTFSISLASPAGQLPDPKILALFGLGAILMRGAGCIINDIWDKDIDKKVARTRDRPLASGQLTNLKALTFLGLQLSCALTILLTFNWYTVVVGVCSMGLVVTYPLMKRVTYWPQAFLGLTFNWGVLLGWSAIAGSIDWSKAIPLYVGCQAWTLVYDTIYAHQDKADDILIGVKSTALKFGDQTKLWLSGFSTVMIICLTSTGVLCEQTWPYYAGVGLVAAHLGHQIWTVDLNDNEDCGRKFRSNRNLGLMFWLAIVASNLLKKSTDEKQQDTKQTMQGSYLMQQFHCDVTMKLCS